MPMPKIDPTSHGSAIVVLLALDIVFLCGLIYAFQCGTAPDALKTTLLTSFSGWNGALAVALNAGAKPKDNNPQDPPQGGGH